MGNTTQEGTHQPGFSKEEGTSLRGGNRPPSHQVAPVLMPTPCEGNCYAHRLRGGTDRTRCRWQHCKIFKGPEPRPSLPAPQGGAVPP